MASNNVLGLAVYHGKILSPEQLGDYVWFFDNQEKIIGEIVARWKFKNAPTSRFPSLMDLTAIASDIKNEQWQKEKTNEATFKTWERSSKTELSRLTVAMIADLYDGKISRADYLKHMRQMDEDFPGIGWANEALSLEQHWESSK